MAHCRLITLNTWKCDGDYPRRLALMAGCLRHLRPDIVCLQECFASDSPAADTAASLAGALGLTAVVAPVRAKIRPFGGEAVVSTSGLAVLSRLPVVAAQVVALPSDVRDGERIAQVIHADWDGASLRVANLHLSHLKDGAALRRRQLMTLLRWMDARPTVPWTVLAGDFNASLDDPEMAPLVAARCGQWEEDAGEAEATVPMTPERPPQRTVDHVLVLQGSGSAPLSLHRRRVLDQPDEAGRYPSDHAGVMLEMRQLQMPMPAWRSAHSRQASRTWGE